MTLHEIVLALIIGATVLFVFFYLRWSSKVLSEAWDRDIELARLLEELGE